jgi:ParB family transcriptional regulator, chromosome partitioning protein
MAAPAPVVAEQILSIPLTSIELSKTNPRKSLDPKAPADLAADIKRRGVQEPILVRPIAGSPARFELVFGERRYRASEKAARETVPSIVRELSDDEAYELQVVENLQREELHFLDEADAFYRFYAKAVEQGKSHEEALKTVSARVAKKPEMIAQRMKLRDLIDPARDAFRKGSILLGHAFELARLREDEQAQALEWMLSRTQDVRTESGFKRVQLMPGVPELKFWIQKYLFLDLTKAPFDVEDAALNPKMGACSGCAFRTGNQPALFKDVKQGSTCTVPSCWSEKRNESLVRMAAATAKELGVESVLKVGLGYRGNSKSGEPVDVFIDYGSVARIVKQGTECKLTRPGVVTWIQFAHNVSQKVGDTVHVCTDAAACSVHKNAASHSERPRKTFLEMADTRVANLRESLPQQIRSALIRAVVEAAQKERRKLSPSDRIRLQLAADQMHADLYFDHHRTLCKLVGAEPEAKEAGQSKDWRGTSAAMFDGNPLALMAAMTLMHHYSAQYVRKGADPLESLLGVYKIDAKAITAKVKAEVKGKIEEIEEAVEKRKAKAAS